jgi:hypothetical protein
MNPDACREGQTMNNGRLLPKCTVEGLIYDFERHIGRLEMPPACCCDMSGCINLFRRIDADVRQIETRSDGKSDAFYWRHPNGQWEAFDTKDGKIQVRFGETDIPKEKQ